MIRVAVDGMGGDHAPKAVVDGAVRAAREYDIEIILVGHKDLLQKELARVPSAPPNLKVHHAEEVVDMAEPAASAVRKKRDSSIMVAVDLVK